MRVAWHVAVESEPRQRLGPRCDAGPVRDAIGAAVIDSGVGEWDTAGSTTTSDRVSRMGRRAREVWTGVSRLSKGDESSAAGASFE